MKVLIDECAPKALKVALAASGFDCTTVQEAGWSGKENGELLALADASFDVVVTIDRNRMPRRSTDEKISESTTCDSDSVDVVRRSPVRASARLHFEKLPRPSQSSELFDHSRVA